jgi:hypothetical protein
MNIKSKFTFSPQMVSRALGDETVILELASGSYFGLDEVGTRMWTLLGEGRSLDETCDVLLGEYAVERDRLEADLLALADQLMRRKLLEINDG